MKKSILKYSTILIMILQMTACAVIAPSYIPSPTNINKLRNSNIGQVQIGEFVSGSAEVEIISFRGTPLTSPHGGSYANYLKEALRQELEWAQLLNTNTNLEITGILLQNELHGASIFKANAKVSAKILIKRDGKILYEKTMSAKHEWESDFSGASAGEKVRQYYPIAFQKLLDSFFSDQDFIFSLKK